MQDPQAGVAAETKAQRRERMQVREQERLGRASARQGGAAASWAPWGAPEQALGREVVGSDPHFGKVT